MEEQSEFKLVGILMGLAVYNGVLLDVNFPPVLYRKLLGRPLSLADLADLSPETRRGLDSLLYYEGPGDVEDVFCLNFEATYDSFGTARTQVCSYLSPPACSMFFEHLRGTSQRLR